MQHPSLSVNVGRKYGIATQDSVGYGGVAERAIDGNTDGYYKK
jgi:hypothetical protein